MIDQIECNRLIPYNDVDCETDEAGEPSPADAADVPEFVYNPQGQQLRRIVHSGGMR
jgi:hypothetical protein